MRLCRVLHDDRERVGFYRSGGVVLLEDAARLRETATGVGTPELAEAALLDCLPPEGPARAAASQVCGWLDENEPAAVAALLPESEYRLLRPLDRPPSIYLLAGNYAAHIEEGGDVAVLRKETFPYVFMKPPTAFSDPGTPFVLPVVSPESIDWELELAVVIGRRAKGIAESEALDHVAGYTVVNDISDRRFRPNPGRSERPRDRFFDWLHGKWHDGSCPMGPCVRSADTVPDPQDLELCLTVNGEVRQSSSTRQQIFPVAAVIEFLASFVTLEPGDVISTGTPAGVGKTTGSYLCAGDRVEATIDGIGTLVTPIAAG